MKKKKFTEQEKLALIALYVIAAVMVINALRDTMSATQYFETGTITRTMSVWRWSK